jgi:signal transduction histidine kinase
MEPITELTAPRARSSAPATPRSRVDAPLADDEVAELARTLDGMLVALAASREEQDAMLRRQREFVADASHELRTPLTSVLANLDFLAETLDGDQGDAARVGAALLAAGCAGSCRTCCCSPRPTPSAWRRTSRSTSARSSSRRPPSSSRSPTATT